jgi:hypothetical protein
MADVEGIAEDEETPGEAKKGYRTDSPKEWPVGRRESWRRVGEQGEHWAKMGGERRALDEGGEEKRGSSEGEVEFICWPLGAENRHKIPVSSDVPVSDIKTPSLDTWLMTEVCWGSIPWLGRGCRRPLRHQSSTITRIMQRCSTADTKREGILSNLRAWTNMHVQGGNMRL